MSSPSQRRELSKLRILQHLSQPEMREFGSVTDKLPTPEPLVESGRLLETMLADGLVERRPDPTHKMAKPYYITQQGSDYLERGVQAAVFPDLGRRRTRATAPDPHGPVADVLRGLPEFRDSDDDRIQEVARGIALAMSQATGRPR